MDEDIDFDAGSAEETEFDYEAHMGLQRHDVRRKIEEILERKRLREEFGELDF